MATRIMSKISPLMTPLFVITLVALHLTLWYAKDDAVGNFLTLFALVLTGIYIVIALTYIGTTLFALYDLHAHCGVSWRQIGRVFAGGIQLRLWAVLNRLAAWAVLATCAIGRKSKTPAWLHWTAVKTAACKEQLTLATEDVSATIEANS